LTKTRQNLKKNLQATFQASKKEGQVKFKKMNKKMMNVLSNLSTTMCHTFIENQTFMSSQINIFEFEFDEQLVANGQNTTN
jgi:hypothetical protein